MLTRVSQILMFMVAAGLAENVLGDTSVSPNNQGSTTLHEITVSPGGTFSTDINFAGNMGYWNLSMYLQASASGVLSVSGFTFHAPFNESEWYTGVPSGGIDPVTSRFGIAAPPNLSVGPGNLTIGTGVIGVNPLASPGTYTLNVADILGVPSPLTPAFDTGTPGPDFTVTITPEPASAMLLGFLLLGVFRRRSIVRTTRRA